MIYFCAWLCGQRVGFTVVIWQILQCVTTRKWRKPWRTVRLYHPKYIFAEFFGTNEMALQHWFQCRHKNPKFLRIMFTNVAEKQEKNIVFCKVQVCINVHCWRAEEERKFRTSKNLFLDFVGAKALTCWHRFWFFVRKKTLSGKWKSRLLMEVCLCSF